MTPKNMTLHISVSEDLLNKIRQDADKAGLSRQAYILQVLEGYKVKELPGEDFFKSLRGVYALLDKLEGLKRETDRNTALNETLKEIKEFILRIEQELI